MKGISLTLVSLTLGGLLGAACTVQQTQAPGLTGPSEFALSLAVTASPDSITQDGRSNSTVAVVARDPNGRPLPNVPLRLDMLVDGQAADYGTLSSRNLVTGSDGRATSVYTAPPAPPAGTSVGGCVGGSGSVPLGGKCVQIVATSVGSDYSGATARMVQIHLIVPGVIVPASATPVANFAIAPTAPAANELAQFDASKSCPGALDGGGSCSGALGAIVSYVWNFGDGGTATGRTAAHAFGRQQTYLVTLTVTDDQGLSSSVTQSVQVGAGVAPTPVIVSSPTAPVTNKAVNFDATQSKAGPGHNLVRFVWNFGDGSALLDSSSPTVSYPYTTAGSYIVTLTVADETGQTASVTATVKVS